MDLAARYLELHGRLVYWLPVYRPRYVIHSFIHSFIHLSVRSFVQALAQAQVPIQFIIRSFIRSFIYFFMLLYFHYLTDLSFSHSFIHLLESIRHSLIQIISFKFYSHNHSLGWSVVHSIIPTYLIFNPPIKSFINSFIHLFSFFLRSFLSTSFIHSFIGVSLGQANLNIKLEKVRLASAIPFLTLLLLIL